MGSYTLPHGARGIEGEDFAIAFGGDKIVFVPKSDGNGTHYTFQAKPASGVMDLHETSIDADGREKHRTLFALPACNVPSLLGELAPMVAELFRLMRPLRLGWLKYHDIGIARGLDPVSDNEIAAVTRKHKRRLALDAQRYEQHVYVPEFLEEVYDFPDGNFSLLHRGRPIGIGFKKTEADGNIRLFWIKRRDLMRFGHDWEQRVIDAFSRLAIPPVRYPDYPFLHP
jgi:hypothetical protein